MVRHKRHRSKACATCGRLSPVMYRIRTTAHPVWKIVCPDCQKSVESKPGYQYGGTWKARKRH